MDAEYLLTQIEQLAQRHDHIANEADANIYRDIRKSIRAELKRLFILDKREEKRIIIRDRMSADLPVEIDPDGDPSEWMDVRDNIDNAEIKLSGICKQFGALHTESLVRNICSNLQHIAHRAFGMGD